MAQTAWSLEAALSSIWEGDIKALLLTTAYNREPDDRFVADVKENEVTADGYSRKALENLTVEVDEEQKIVSRKADPLVWSDLNLGTERVGTVVIYKDSSGDDAESEIIDFLTPREIGTNNETLNLTLNFDATGVGFIRYEAPTTGGTTETTTKQGDAPAPPPPPAT
jgi:hypothetical protein